MANRSLQAALRDTASVSDVLDAIREDYEGEGEYLHVYPAVDHR